MSNGVHHGNGDARLNGHTDSHTPRDVLKQSQNSMDLGSILQWTKSPDEERRVSNSLASTAESVDLFVSCSLSFSLNLARMSSLFSALINLSTSFRSASLLQLLL